MNPADLIRGLVNVLQTLDTSALLERDLPDKSKLSLKRLTIKAHSGEYLSLKDFETAFKESVENTRKDLKDQQDIDALTTLSQLGQTHIRSIIAVTDRTQKSITRDKGKPSIAPTRKVALSQIKQDGLVYFTSTTKDASLEFKGLDDDVQPVPIAPTYALGAVSTPTIKDVSQNLVNPLPKRKRDDHRGVPQASLIQVADYSAFYSFAPQTDSSTTTLSFAESVRAVKHRKILTSSKPSSTTKSTTTSETKSAMDVTVPPLTDEINVETVLKNACDDTFGGDERRAVAILENQYLLSQWQELQSKKSAKQRGSLSDEEMHIASLVRSNLARLMPEINQKQISDFKSLRSATVRLAALEPAYHGSGLLVRMVTYVQPSLGANRTPATQPHNARMPRWNGSSLPVLNADRQRNQPDIISERHHVKTSHATTTSLPGKPKIPEITLQSPPIKSQLAAAADPILMNVLPLVKIKTNKIEQYGRGTEKVDVTPFSTTAAFGGVMKPLKESSLNVSTDADVTKVDLLDQPNDYYRACIQKYEDVYSANSKRDTDASVEYLELRDESGEVYRIPSQVAFISATLKHIHVSSKNFLEGLNRQITFPTLSRDLMLQVVCFLYYSWFTTRLNQDALESICIPDFEPRLSDVVCLADAGVYLDLQNLVERCIDIVAQNFDLAEHALETIPAPLLRCIIRKLSAVDLLFFEYSKYCPNTSKLWQSLYTEVMLHEKGRWAMDMFVANSRHKNGFEGTKLHRLMAIQRDVEFLLGIMLSENTVSKIVRALSTNQIGSGIQSLWLHLGPSNTLPIDAWRSVLEALPNLKVIKLEILAMNERHMELVLHLLTLYQNCRIILDVAVEQSMLDDEVFEFMSTVAESTQENRTIQSNITSISTTRSPIPPIVDRNQLENESHAIELCVRHDRSGISTMHLLSLVRQITFFSSVTCRSLSLQSQALPADGDFLFSSCLSTRDISQRLRLRHLNLERCNLGGSGILSLVESLQQYPTLTSLNVTGNISLHDPKATAAGIAIAKWLATPTCKIQEISLSDNFFTNTALVAIAEATRVSPKLRTLRLRGVDLNVGALDLFASVAGRQWCLLDLSHTLIRPQTFQKALDLWINSTSLKLPEAIYFDGLIFTDSIISTIGDILIQQNTIKKIGLAGRKDIPTDIQLDWKPVMKALAKIKHLTELNLSNHAIQDDFFADIISTLPKSGLEKIYLAGNLITNSSALLLEKLLKKGHLGRRISINLEENCISPSCCKALQKCITERCLINISNQKGTR
ncbi:hypothetical protein HDV05_001342 [Chytridiales sp. JEL 0842]|nr:hypothetical protein HDV05_001342 [Chytridiales sp. JEL 0842]